jgi:hypothetical protein
MAPGRSHTEVFSGLTAFWLPPDHVGRNCFPIDNAGRDCFPATGNETKPELVKVIDASQSVT